MKGWLAVANAYSGGGEGKRDRIEKAIGALRPTVKDVVFSEYRGHSKRIAASASGYTGIVAAGGDGTLFEVLNGIDRKRQELAILPAGRGNSLARDLGLGGIPSAVKAFADGNGHAIDLAEVTFTTESGEQTRVASASTIAVGYPVIATILANHLKNLGSFCYPVAAALASIRMKAAPREVVYDRDRPRRKRLTGLIINNTRHLANFLAFPNADCTDGRLDVMEMDAGLLSQNVRNLSALCGIDLCAPAPIHQVQTATLCFAKPTTIMIDGEIFKDVITFHVQILPGALRCRRMRNI
ncbi:MAG TPA: diacylglycerol kinase family protein [Candidatus Binataceae bacterium]|nr:diacylglycerol kinase family protein [Candidatus Binataceae bacterium]